MAFDGDAGFALVVFVAMLAALIYGYLVGVVITRPSTLEAKYIRDAIAREIEVCGEDFEKCQTLRELLYSKLLRR